eukprot:5922887-Prorocentrum_lima.AAC.1
MRQKRWTRWRKLRLHGSRGSIRERYEVYNLWFRDALPQMMSATSERTSRRKRCTNGHVL